MSEKFSKSPFLPETEVFPEEKEDNIFKQQQTYQDIAGRLNIRDVGLYIQEEIQTGQQYFPLVTRGINRKVYRHTYPIPALLNPGPTTIAHGITFPAANVYHFTRIYGVIEDLAAPLYVPIPNNDVHLEVNGTNIVISGYPGAYFGYTGVVVIEYTKS